MRTIIKALFVNLLILLSFQTNATQIDSNHSNATQLKASDKLPQVLFKTSLGDFTMEIDIVNAPITAQNFISYIKQKRFKGAHFYRTVTLDNQPENDIKIEVIQGGLGFEESAQSLAPIEHELTTETGIKHLNGVLSMARLEPGTASSEFFICINDQPELDFGGKRNPDGQGFAAFGRLVSGEQTLLKIHRQKNEQQMLINNINIYEITLIK